LVKSNVLALFLTINILTVLKAFTRLNPFAFQNWKKKITYPKFEIYLFNKQQFWNFSQIKSFDSSEICNWVDMGLWNKLKSSSQMPPCRLATHHTSLVHSVTSFFYVKMMTRFLKKAKCGEIEENPFFARCVVCK